MELLVGDAALDRDAEIRALRRAERLPFEMGVDDQVVLTRSSDGLTLWLDQPTARPSRHLLRFEISSDAPEGAILQYIDGFAVRHADYDVRSARFESMPEGLFRHSDEHGTQWFLQKYEAWLVLADGKSIVRPETGVPSRKVLPKSSRNTVRRMLVGRRPQKALSG